MSNELFISHLNYQVTEHEIREIFSQWGTIDKLHILRDKTTNKSRGVGFISYFAKNSCYQAIKYGNNMTIRGMKINLNFSNNSRKQNNHNHNKNNNFTNSFSNNYAANNMTPMYQTTFTLYNNQENRMSPPMHSPIPSLSPTPYISNFHF